MNYKYNISHKSKKKPKKINFKSEASMIKYIIKNKSTINKLTQPVIHFGAISLPYKVTTWGNISDD